ncbi:hypothetical protein HY404_04275 [Candidatus Microgenomates bacterium]|nr:hypothetical protein [Candidatus Microgenomates bacterium]
MSEVLGRNLDNENSDQRLRSLRECKKCGGDLFEEDDGLGVDIVCLQCGDRRSVAQWMSEQSQGKGESHDG